MCFIREMGEKSFEVDPLSPSATIYTKFMKNHQTLIQMKLSPLIN